MIAVRSGWVRVVYEGQGEPFVMHAGDIVLQPPEIRHRVLESSPGVEVIEISGPALHETFADHDLGLPGGGLTPDRDFSGQHFLRHVAAESPWKPWHGAQAQETAMSAATNGLAEVRLLRPGSDPAVTVPPHDGELVFGFLLEGSAMLDCRGSTPLGPADSFVIPPGEAWGLSNLSPDMRLLHVTTAPPKDRAGQNPPAAPAPKPSIGCASEPEGTRLKRPNTPRIAVLLPCYNEEAAIEATVAGFRSALPGATVYVYDNNSSDRTRAVAAAAGAVVRNESQQGKGHVVRRMFADIDADIYVMADGDLTYDPGAAPAMVALLVADQLDMVVGTRRHEEKDAYRGGHVVGNRLFTGLLSGLFGRTFSDIFSGYRVFSRRFVKSFPVLSSGFEIETEMSVHALELKMPVGEIETAYGARPEGSHCKLSTFGDGWRILTTIATLYRIERPLLYFGGLGGCSCSPR